MGRALASDPQAAGADHADRRRRRAVQGDAARRRRATCRRRGTAVLIVSDELDDLRNCDRVLVMFQGRIVARDGRTAGATTTWSPRWKGSTSTMSETQSDRRAADGGAAARAASGRGIALARLRDLALVPAIIVIAIVGYDRQPGVPAARQHHQRPADACRRSRCWCSPRRSC